MKLHITQHTVDKYRDIVKRDCLRKGRNKRKIRRIICDSVKITKGFQSMVERMSLDDTTSVIANLRCGETDLGRYKMILRKTIREEGGYAYLMVDLVDYKV